MTIAAIIPCRNGGAFLDEALASVHAQSLAVDEIIVVDDGSTDDSVQIARAAGATVLSTPSPRGGAAARNLGWRHARSDLLAFLDADDRWLPHHCATVAALLDAHPTVVLGFGGAERVGLSRGRFNPVLPNGVPVDARIESAIWCVVPQMAVIIRRAALEAVGGYDESLTVSQDFELFARLSRLGPFIGAPEITAEYRQHPTQVTRTKSREIMVACARVRARSLAALRREASAEEVAEAEGRIRQIWLADLRGAWRNGDRATFDALVEAAATPRAADAQIRRWRRRGRWGWRPYHALRRVWNLLRLRRVLNALTGQAGRLPAGSP